MDDVVLSEELVTKALLKHLLENGWKILAYDFPQSGTGVPISLVSSKVNSFKNKETVIPDVIAINGNRLLISENKSVDTLGDYQKLFLLSNNAVFKKNLIKKFDLDQNIDFLYSIAFSGSFKNKDKLLKYNFLKAIISVNSILNINFEYGSLG